MSARPGPVLKNEVGPAAEVWAGLVPLTFPEICGADNPKIDLLEELLPVRP